MKWMRVLWAGASLLLVLPGCSHDKTVQGGGVYSPLITGLAVDPSPAVRGLQNELTLQVTNVNNYAITYHWSSPNGAFSDSTHQTAAWLAPDTIGFYPVTCSIQAQAPDSGVSFYKATTYQVFVDNAYVRWTRSSNVQFDPAPAPTPMSDSGVVFSEYTNISTGASNIYQVAVAGNTPVPLTQNFFSAFSPSMRADGQVVAFAGKKTNTDGGASIWLVPSSGGADTTGAYVEARHNINTQRFLGAPRYSRTGTTLLYSSDTTTVGSGPRPWFRDAGFLYPAPPAPANRVIAAGSLGTRAYFGANWGPDVDANGIPDSVVTQTQQSFGTTVQASRGIYKLRSSPPQTSGTVWMNDFTIAEPDWSEDGRYIIFTRPNTLSPDRDIWIIPAGATSLSAAVRVTSGPADDSHPRFSNDGSSIYFVSNRADAYGLNGLYPIERRGTNIWSVSLFDLP